MYIAIEGLDGAGKSTASRAIRDFVRERFVKNDNKDDMNKHFDEHEAITFVREPGGTPLGEILRSIVKSEHEGETIDIRTETLLFFASRNQLLTNVVVPALEAGKIVISDRCYLSSVAYQNNPLVEYLCENELVARPDLIIYMDITPEIGLERAKSREELDRIEQKGLDFFYKTRANYQAYADTHDYVVTVDAHESIEDVYKVVYQVLVDWFDK